MNEYLERILQFVTRTGAWALLVALVLAALQAAQLVQLTEAQIQLILAILSGLGVTKNVNDLVVDILALARGSKPVAFYNKDDSSSTWLKTF